MAAMLRHSVVVVVVVRTRPRAIPLAKITMRKSAHGFPSLFHTSLSMGHRLLAELRYIVKIRQIINFAARVEISMSLIFLW